MPERRPELACSTDDAAANGGKGSSHKFAVVKKRVSSSIFVDRHPPPENTQSHGYRFIPQVVPLLVWFIFAREPPPDCTFATRLLRPCDLTRRPPRDAGEGIVTRPPVSSPHCQGTHTHTAQPPAQYRTITIHFSRRSSARTARTAQRRPTLARLVARRRPLVTTRDTVRRRCTGGATCACKRHALGGVRETRERKRGRPVAPPIARPTGGAAAYNEAGRWRRL